MAQTTTDASTSLGAKTLGLLSSLYFAQGVPYGFFVQALPVLMRQQGRSLQEIGLSSLLMLPWGLKMLMAPVVDRHGGSPLGRRRGWIIPLQLLTVVAVIGLACIDAAASPLQLLAFGVVVTAALSATQDCATDGLAVTLLSHAQRGLGNGVQVAAYRIGMAVSAGGLSLVFALYGWFPTFMGMALLLLLASLPIMLWREPSADVPAPRVALSSSTLMFLRRPRMVWWLLMLGLYKIGDAAGSPMVKPMLVDAGMGIAQIGWVSGSLGAVAALVGALCGGWCSGRFGRKSTLLWAGVLHAALLGLYAASVSHGTSVLSAVLVLEHFTGSMATVGLFTVMMDASDPAFGATDYTLQATVVVLATAIGSGLSGFAAHGLGYSWFFIACGVISAVGAVVLWWALRHDVTPPLFTPARLASTGARTAIAS